MQEQYTAAQKEHRRLARKKVLKEKVIPHILLLFFAIIYFIPFLWLLSTSFKTPSQVFAQPPKWIPSPFVWENYPKAVRTIPFFTYMKNTVILAVIPIFGQVLASSLVAYSIAKIPWKGGRPLFLIILSTMMLPYQVTMIPMYVTWAKLGLINTFAPLLIPSLFGGAYNIFLLRQFFKTVPNSLLEAARIDGASEGRIFFQIMLPLTKPVLTTIALFTFMAGWNDFMTPLIYLNDSVRWPLSIGLQAFMIEFDKQWELLMAASVLFTIPMIITFFIGQKQFIEGIVTTGIK